MEGRCDIFVPGTSAVAYVDKTHINLILGFGWLRQTEVGGEGVGELLPALCLGEKTHYTVSKCSFLVQSSKINVMCVFLGCLMLFDVLLFL